MPKQDMLRQFTTSPQKAGMTTENAANKVTEPVKKQLSGFQTALRYTGIPPSWLEKKPRLPSRNTLIFLSVVSSVVGYYVYDRKQCKKIRQHYVDLVKPKGEELVNPFEWPRKVTVYANKWPGDEDYDQGMKYFRKYVKPILVAGAVDYDMVTGRRHGDLVDRVSDEIKARRRQDAGLEQAPELQVNPLKKTLSDLRNHQQEGGIVIIGRPAFKEFMAGLKKGWSETTQKVDRDEQLSHELDTDDYFDEIDEPVGIVGLASDEVSHQAPEAHHVSQSDRSSENMFLVLPSAKTDAPAIIPRTPALLLVPFTDYIGFKQIPLMIWDWFNQRHKVHAGAEAGYRLIMNQTRPFIPPPTSTQPTFTSTNENSQHSEADKGDIAFDREAEYYFKNSLRKTVADIDEAREKYYKQLPERLATARALQRGTREPTKDEIANPPPTEVELRTERMNKERRWRRDAAGWELIQPSRPVVWDDRFAQSLHVFADPTSQN